MIDMIVFRPTTCHNRHQEHDSVYHLYNRVAHSVRFLDETEKNDLLDRVRRVSGFCGIKLLSWCMMTNHFHLLVYLPPIRELSADEIMRRFRLLQPDERGAFEEGFVLNRAPREIVKRMCNIGMFMKIVKENFTLSYNDRTGHRGTMWEGPYRFKKVPMNVADLMCSAAYQNLNPMRACMAGDYTSYPWTSYAAASRGDNIALAGIEFMAGGYENRTGVSDTSVRTCQDLIECFRAEMDRTMTDWEFARAEAVVRRRIAERREDICDPLVSEAVMVQVEARKAKLMSEDFHAELSKIMKRSVSDDELAVVRAMSLDPMVKGPDLAKLARVSLSRIKRICLTLQNSGIVIRKGTRRSSVWSVRAGAVSETAA